MPSNTDVFVFGDQTAPVLDQLHRLLLVRDNVHLANFFTEVFNAIRHEISLLPAAERWRFPQREAFMLLVEALRTSQAHPALDSALCCVYEIGYYIEYLAQSGRQHPPSNKSAFVGICTGSLAASAISCSSNVWEIIRLGAQAVAVAFRCGMQIHSRATNLGYAEPGSWAMVLPLMQEPVVEQALNEYCSEKTMTQPLRPYVSAVGPKFVTISGPPDVLERVRQLPAFSSTKSRMMPVRGPYHNAQAYLEADQKALVETILKDVRLLDRQSLVPIISSATGAANKGTFSSLLQRCIIEDLTMQMRIDSVLNGLSNLVQENDGETTIFPVNTPICSDMASALRGMTGRNIQPAKDLTDLWRNSEKPASVGTSDNSKIAIIGFSGRYPECSSNQEFWDMLMAGLDVHKRIPEDRFAHDHYDPTGKQKNTSKVPYGCFLKDAGMFDPAFFHLSPKEARQTDPAQRLALLTAYEALEMAGFVPDRTPSTQRTRVGVYYGTTSNDWGEVNSSQDIDTYYIPGANRAFIPGKVNYFFKFSGPSIAVDTACSSSLAAIDMAINSLLQKDVDTAVAGGTNVLTNPDNYAGLDRGHFLSRTGNCKTFDDGADGYCRADGVGTVILKRLEDALADKDPVFGVILGAATNHNAESVSITRPLADAQTYLFSRLLNHSGIHPHDVSYVEMHGTGTQAGDAVEMMSVLETFANDYSRPANKSLHLGSVKSNVGHGESSSGVTALIKVLLMMQHSLVPPHCGIKTKINHGFPTDFDKRNVHIALSGKAESWNRPEAGFRRAFVNNFSAAGGNSSLLLQDAPFLSDELKTTDPRKYHSFVISARSSKALEENTQALADYIGYGKADPELLSQLAYTLTARRMHHNRRIALVSHDTQDLRRQLLHAATLADNVKAVPAKTPDLGFIFTGQGTQATGMAMQLYNNFSSFRSDVHEFDSIAKLQGLPSVLPLIDGSVPIDDLSPTVIQLGTCIMQMALARFWINLGIKPQYVIGHSLGDYAALHIAGVLSVNDTIYLCGHRSLLLEKKCTPGTHSMLAVRSAINRQHIPGALPLEIACINTSEDTVLSGLSTDIHAYQLRLEQQGIKSTKLDLPFAFHSSQVDPILDDLDELAGHVQFRAPTVPFVSSLLSKTITTAEDLGPQYIRRHCRQTVNFAGAVSAASKDNTLTNDGICVEIGAHPILSRMVKNILGNTFQCCSSLKRNEDFSKTMSESLNTLHLAGLLVNWDEYHRDFPMSQRVVSLPRYNWQLANYWFTYEYSWCLTKGDPPEASIPAPPPKRLRLSDSVQEVLGEKHTDTDSFIVAQSDLHEGGLVTVVKDHRVNEVVLCPSTLYADVAFTLGMHLINNRKDKSRDLTGFNTEVNNMVAENALLINETGPQMFRVTATMDWKTFHGKLRIFTANEKGGEKLLHASCDIGITKPAMHYVHWQQYRYLINRAMTALREGTDNENIHHLKRVMAYRLFSASVQYGPAYHGIQEAWFDGQGLEATTDVHLAESNGDFRLNPFACDSLGHITGLVMNCNDKLNVADNVYVNHGWQFLTVYEPYAAGVDYQTYVRMHPVKDDDSEFAGDVHVLKDGNIIAICGGVTFKKVSKKVLQLMLPKPGSKGQKNSATKKEPAASVAVAEIKKPASPTDANGPAPTAVVKAIVASESKEQVVASSGLLTEALKIVADEIGVDEAKLVDSFSFTDMGVDSLMALTVLASFREELDIDIPAMEFASLVTVKDLRTYFETKFGATEKPAASGTATPDSIASSGSSNIDVEESKTGATTPPSEVEEESEPITIKKESVSIPRSTSMLLQGTKRCPKTLWMFPDGAGSATSYVTVPNISSDLRVYGLNSPYLTKPRDFKCALQDITTSYLAELRRRQPHGPYYLAGWSAGGSSAYDAARQLVEEGEEVAQLILIDSPNPVGLGKLPPRMYTFLEESGIFSGMDGPSEATNTAPPDWLFQHFLVFIEALDKYIPRPFAPGTAPPTTIIWAQDGVCKYPDDARPEKQEDDPKGMTWLLENRTDFGTNGWGKYLSEDEGEDASCVTLHSVENANHFTLMREPRAEELCALLRDAIGV